MTNGTGFLDDREEEREWKAREFCLHGIGPIILFLLMALLVCFIVGERILR